MRWRTLKVPAYKLREQTSRSDDTKLKGNTTKNRTAKEERESFMSVNTKNEPEKTDLQNLTPTEVAPNQNECLTDATTIDETKRQINSNSKR